MSKQSFTSTHLEGRIEHYISIFPDSHSRINQLLWDFTRTNAVSWVNVIIGYDDLDCNPDDCTCEGNIVKNERKIKLHHPWPERASFFSDEKVDINTPILSSIHRFIDRLYSWKSPRRQEQIELAQSLSNPEA